MKQWARFVRLLQKWAISGIFFVYFCLFNKFYGKKTLLMAGFEPWISGVRSNRSTNCAKTTTGHAFFLPKCLCLAEFRQSVAQFGRAVTFESMPAFEPRRLKAKIIEMAIHRIPVDTSTEITHKSIVYDSIL